MVCNSQEEEEHVFLDNCLFSCNKMRAKGARMLGEALKKNAMLTELNLRGDARKVMTLVNDN